MKKNKRGKEFGERRKSNNGAQAALTQPLPFRQRHARVFMTLALLLSDTASLLLAYGSAVWLRISLLGDSTFLQSWNVIPILVFFLLVYAWYGLYPGVGLSPVHEMKQLVSATNIVFLLLISVTFWVQTSTNYSRLMLAAAWLITLVLVQVDRWLTRILGRNIGFWGEPVAVVGSGPQGQQIVKFLNERLRLGMRPVFNIDGYAEDIKTHLVAINRMHIRTVILVVTEMSDEMQKLFSDQRFENSNQSIPRLILISSLGYWSSLNVKPLDLDGKLGLEISNNLNNRLQIAIKRGMDLVMAVVGGLLISPLLLLIAVAIKLDSRGGIIYKQKRVGRYGKFFHMWKFRTMRADADRIMHEMLAANPEMKAEWEATQKLKHDPRVTRVGRFLRKFSLDELPQIFNVLKGEMSIVGPRPIVEDENRRYKGIFNKYKKVCPGVTGLWQVSGRNDTTYDLRVQMDEYYIHNWSPWLDIYILLRTVMVVLTKEGAY